MRLFSSSLPYVYAHCSKATTLAEWNLKEAHTAETFGGPTVSTYDAYRRWPIGSTPTPSSTRFSMLFAATQGKMRNTRTSAGTVHLIATSITTCRNALDSIIFTSCWRALFHTIFLRILAGMDLLSNRPRPGESCTTTSRFVNSRTRGRAY